MGEGLEIAVDAALSAFSDASQHHRLMRLDFPLKDGPTAILLPNKLLAHEEVSRSFRFDVEVLSDDPRIPLKALMGRMVTISLVREDGSQRYFNGYITEFRFLRSDGGFAFYRMVLEPWLAFARLRKDAWTKRAWMTSAILSVGFLTGCSERAPSPLPPGASKPGIITITRLTPPGVFNMRLTETRARYIPIELNQHTADTSVNWDCGGASHIPIPRLPEPCRITRAREKAWPISGLDAISQSMPSASAAVAPSFIQRQNVYQLVTIEFTLERCHGKCVKETYHITISCRPDRIEKVVTGYLLVAFHSGDGNDTDKEKCGIEPPRPGEQKIQTEQDIIGRLRGHIPYSDDKYALVSAVPMLPSPSGEWRLNPVAAFSGKTFEDLCPPEQGSNKYQPITRKLDLSSTETWQLGTSLNVRADLGRNGEACEITVSSPDQLEEEWEYRYTFAASQLIQVQARKRMSKSEETWRYTDGLPVEYIRSQGNRIGAGAEIWYWHSVAARDWPSRMTYIPDMDEFANHQHRAAQLLEQMDAKPNSVAIP